MKTDWAREFTSIGGTPLTSRWTQKRIAATDHCVGVIRHCPTCHESYFQTAIVTTCYRCQKDAE